jgi:carboxylesterase
MPQPDHLDPSAYAADRGPVGVLLIHGYTGAVTEVRGLGEYLAAQGFSVRCPLLAGHGTSPEELTQVRSWRVWAGEVEAALLELQDRCDLVFAGGLSTGSLLALWLGAHHPELAGLIAMAPALKLRSPLAPAILAARHLLTYNPLRTLAEDHLRDPEGPCRIWCYDTTPLWGAGEVYRLGRHVRGILHDIRQPVLIFQGRYDPHVADQAPQMVLGAVGSTDKTLIWLDHSGHNLLADGERESVWARCHAWILERCDGEEGQ